MCRLLLIWLASFTRSLSLSLFLSFSSSLSVFSYFSFYSSSRSYPISSSTFYFTLLSSLLCRYFLLLLWFSSVVTAFLSIFSYLVHFVTARSSGSLNFYMSGLAAILPFPPTPFKGSPFTSALHLSLSRIIFSSTCPPLYRSHHLISISFISLPPFSSLILFYFLSFPFHLLPPMFLHRL